MSAPAPSPALDGELFAFRTTARPSWWQGYRDSDVDLFVDVDALGVKRAFISGNAPSDSTPADEKGSSVSL